MFNIYYSCHSQFFFSSRKEKKSSYWKCEKKFRKSRIEIEVLKRFEQRRPFISEIYFYNLIFHWNFCAVSDLFRKCFLGNEQFLSEINNSKKKILMEKIIEQKFFVSAIEGEGEGEENFSSIVCICEKFSFCKRSRSMRKNRN